MTEEEQQEKANEKQQETQEPVKEQPAKEQEKEKPATKQEPAKAIIEIEDKKENPSLDRQEITAYITSSRTPSKNETKKLLAEKLNAPEELIAVKNILSSFGKQEFKIIAYLYSDKESFQKLEAVKKKKPKAKKKEEKKEGEVETEKKEKEETKPVAKEQREEKKE